MHKEKEEAKNRRYYISRIEIDKLNYSYIIEVNVKISDALSSHASIESFVYQTAHQSAIDNFLKAPIHCLKMTINKAHHRISLVI